MPQFPFRPCAKPHNRSAAFVPFRDVERDHCPEACCRITALDVAYWFAKLAVWPPRLCPLAALRWIIWRSRRSTGGAFQNIPVDDPPKSGIEKPGVAQAFLYSCL